MPYYDYRCLVCRKLEPHYQKIADRDLPQSHCGLDMRREISAPALLPDIASYISPASGKRIDSRAQRREDMLREGCIPNEPGLKEHIAQRAAYEQDIAYNQTVKTIDETVTALQAAGHIQGD